MCPAHWGNDIGQVKVDNKTQPSYQCTGTSESDSRCIHFENFGLRVTKTVATSGKSNLFWSSTEFGDKILNADGH